MLLSNLLPLHQKKIALLRRLRLRIEERSPKLAKGCGRYGYKSKAKRIPSPTLVSNSMLANLMLSEFKVSHSA